MKIYLYIYVAFFTLIFSGQILGQSLRLKAETDQPENAATLDSVITKTIFPNARELQQEAEAIPDRLKRKGFFYARIDSAKKESDSVFAYHVDFGHRTKTIVLYLNQDPALKQTFFPNLPDSLSLPPEQLEDWMSLRLQEMERAGYSLAQLRLGNLQPDKDKIHADLILSPGTKRTLNDIVIQGYDKFPEGHKKAIRRLYRNRVFNQETLQELYSDFSKFRFVNQTRYPEILFTTDTTKVFVYLEKAKNSRFDGLIGFANDDENSKIVFSGYLDLQLVNMANTGEEFTLYWKSDGQKQRTFNAALELPYLFKSRFGIRAQLNIFKQDSTFQNTKTSAELGYLIRYNSRVYLGYQATESSDIQNQNTVSVNDYQNRFLTLGYNLAAYKPDDFLFPEKTRIALKAGIGNRDAKLRQDSQYFFEADVRHNFYLNEKNSIALRTQDFYLVSSGYTVSELYRFGGINSMRGFNENSLQGNLFASILTEYRYVLSPGLYIHSLLDYGYFKDEASDQGNRLLGLGFGFGLVTKAGMLNLVYANGSAGGDTIKFSNSIVHLSLKTTF